MFFIILRNLLNSFKTRNIVSIRSDHGGEFENRYFELFCDENGIEHNFLHVEPLNKMELLRGKIGL